MVSEEGYILMAAAELVHAEARRSGLDLDSMITKTIKTFIKLRTELAKPENI